MSGKRTAQDQITSLIYLMGTGNTYDPFKRMKLASNHVFEAEQRGRELERAERAKDTERLEWLSRQFKTGTVYMSGDCTFAPNHRVHVLKGRNFRDAIDAAMRGNDDA